MVDEIGNMRPPLLPLSPKPRVEDNLNAFDFFDHKRMARQKTKQCWKIHWTYAERQRAAIRRNRSSDCNANAEELAESAHALKIHRGQSEAMNFLGLLARNFELMGEKGTQ